METDILPDGPQPSIMLRHAHENGSFLETIHKMQSKAGKGFLGLRARGVIAQSELTGFSPPLKECFSIPGASYHHIGDVSASEKPNVLAPSSMGHFSGCKKCRQEIPVPLPHNYQTLINKV